MISVAGMPSGGASPLISAFISSMRALLTPSKVTTRAKAIESLPGRLRQHYAPREVVRPPEPPAGDRRGRAPRRSPLAGGRGGAREGEGRGRDARGDLAAADRAANALNARGRCRSPAPAHEDGGFYLPEGAAA